MAITNNRDKLNIAMSIYLEYSDTGTLSMVKML